MDPEVLAQFFEDILIAWFDEGYIHDGADSESESGNIQVTPSPSLTFKSNIDPIQIIYSQTPIQESLFDHLDIIGIVRFSSTCTRAREICLGHIVRHYDIYRYLSPFFPDPSSISSFRYLQARTGALISGSNALQFFLGARWPESDLDVYVHSKHIEELAQFFMDIGYRFEPREDQPNTLEGAIDECVETSHPEYTVVMGWEHDSEWHEVTRWSQLHDPDEDYATMKGLFGVFSFVKWGIGLDSRRSVARKVQIIGAEYAPMEVILDFHSTVVMNVLSHHSAYCLYPIATLRDREMAFFDLNDSRRQEACAKYRKRGWKLVGWNFPRKNAKYPLPNKNWINADRWVGDPYTFTIPLGPIRHPDSATNATASQAFDGNVATNPEDDNPPRDLVVLNGWSLRTSFGRIEIEARALLSKSLSNVYMFPSTPASHDRARRDIAQLVTSLCKSSGDRQK